jgi:hypothetical protein
MVLLAGSVAWLLVGGGLAATCLLLPASPSRHSEPAAAVAVVPAAVIAAPARPAALPARPPAPAAKPAVPPPAAAAGKVIEKKRAPAPSAPAPARPTLPASERLLADAPPDFKNYGTQVDFLESPAEAAQVAVREHKLCFVLHLSGNFEDAKFT